MADVDHSQPPRHVWIGSVWVDVSLDETHAAGAEVSEHPVEQGSNIADHIRPTPRVITIEGLVTNHPLELPQSHAGTAAVDPSSIELSVAPNVLPRLPPNSISIDGEPSAGLLGVLPGVDQSVAILGALRLDVLSKRQLAAEQNNVDISARTSLAANALRFTEPFNRVEAVFDALNRVVDQSELVTLATGLMVYDNVAISDLSIKRSSELGRDRMTFTATCRVLRIVQSEIAQLPQPRDKRGLPAQSQGKQSTQAAPPTVGSEKTDSFLSKIFD
jgi:hypothetical protein